MQWNGLKFLASSGMFLNGKENQELWAIADSGKRRLTAWDALGRHIRRRQPGTPHDAVRGKQGENLPIERIGGKRMQIGGSGKIRDRIEGDRRRVHERRAAARHGAAGDARRRAVSRRTADRRPVTPCWSSRPTARRSTA